jgi:hypothetical protein
MTLNIRSLYRTLSLETVLREVKIACHVLEVHEVRWSNDGDEPEDICFLIEVGMLIITQKYAFLTSWILIIILG